MQDEVAKKRERKQLKMGKYGARLIKIIGFGTLKNTYNPSWEPKNTIKFTFETPEVTDIFFKDGVREPYVISKEFNRYLSTGSKLGEFLNGLKPGFIPDTPGAKVDYGKLIGMACEISVIEKKQKKDATKKNSQIQDGEPLPEGSQLKLAHNPLLLFDLGSMECKYKESQGVKGPATVLPWYMAFRYLNSWEQKQVITALEFDKYCEEHGVTIRPAEKFNDVCHVEKDGEVLIQGTIGDGGESNSADYDAHTDDENVPF